MVEWTCQEDANIALAGNKTYSTWQQGFLNIFHLVLENKTFILNVYHSISREHLERYLYQLAYDLLIGVVEEKPSGCPSVTVTRRSLPTSTNTRLSA